MIDFALPPSDGVQDAILSATELLTKSPCDHARRVLTSSKDMSWATPNAWFEYLDLEFAFTLDPCCETETAKCKRYFTPLEDGLAQPWADERVYMNPPLRETNLILDEESLRRGSRPRRPRCLSGASQGRYQLVAFLRGKGERYQISERASQICRGERLCAVSCRDRYFQTASLELCGFLERRLYVVVRPGGASRVAPPIFRFVCRVSSEAAIGSAAPCFLA